MFHKRIVIGCFLVTAIHAAGQTFNFQEKKSIFDKTRELFSKEYHFTKLVGKTMDYLDQQWDSGAYDKLIEKRAFTDSLRNDLRHFTKDLHLNYFYTEAKYLLGKPGQKNIPLNIRSDNYLNEGINQVQFLSGNIGYFRIRVFGDLEKNKDELAALFVLLQKTKALIIDVRDNGGGALSNSIISYLLPHDSVHLNTIYWNDRTDSIYTYRQLSGPRFIDKPVYVLINRNTFSSAEEFAYDLQQLKRATIVGEASGGGANPGWASPVFTFDDGSRLDLFIPRAEVINPVTKTNWEGKGVQPDTISLPGDALKKAHHLALEYLIQREDNPVIIDKYREIQQAINK